jgi:hypothetical protein
MAWLRGIQKNDIQNNDIQHYISRHSDMFYNFYLEKKNHIIAINSTLTQATEKISTYLESLELI